jgi:hypothetical protein
MAKETLPEFTDADTGAGITKLPQSVQTMMVDLRSWQEQSDPNQVSLDILDRILTTESFEEAIGNAVVSIEELMQAQAILTIADVTWHPSTKGELGVFAVIHCKDDSGHKLVTTCGGRNIVAILYRAMKDDKLPLKVRFRSATTQSDYETYWLDPVA